MAGYQLSKAKRIFDERSPVTEIAHINPFVQTDAIRSALVFYIDSCYHDRINRRMIFNHYKKRLLV
jgi:hypothetical protein